MKLVFTTIAVIFFLLVVVGCGGTGGGSDSSEEEAEEETTTSSAAAASSSEGTSGATEETTAATSNVSASVTLAAMNGSGTTGTATFTDVAQGEVRVTLSAQGLPDPNVTYLTHIHPGTCADEQGGEQEEAEEQGSEEEQQGSGHEHDEHSGHEAGTNEEIEYPLPPITANPQGRGTTLTVLEGVTVQELYSGEPKYINVHAEGSGNPPALACGQLSMNIKSSAPNHSHS